MKTYIPIPSSERGSNYSVAGETWCENFKRAAFAKKYAVAATKETGSLVTVLRESDKQVWCPDTRKWSNS